MNTETLSTLRKNFEIFLCWFAAAHLVRSFLAGLGIPVSIAYMVKQGGSFDSTGLLWLTTLAASLPGVVTAVWMWKREYSSNKSRIIWTIFGLASALWAICFYLLMIIVTDRLKDKTANELIDKQE
ncbi:hypothetical protein HW115_18825 [Verrucomicrobiaceae bacterium N1E253]|uniref:Uncharacterized protein n=1 Tax=Oceaniferula marina TaxID=2748318 RepID=A0A851GKL2_9BACT|nr:hypothetical protein [Oceaniferula marina]NWK57679.1 hypothetical protein [Oceaniferula marina]